MNPATHTFAPHILHPRSVASIQMDRLIALIPILAGLIWYTEPRALLLCAVVAASCVVGDAGASAVRNRTRPVFSLRSVGDGLLLALLLPLSLSLPLAAAGTVLCAMGATLVFGQPGKRLFPPILFARLLLGFARPDLFGADPALIARIPVLLILAGAVYLYLRSVISLTVPLTALWTSVLLFWAFSGSSLFAASPLSFLENGIVVFAFFFLLTDYASCPVTRSGRILYAFAAGLLAGLLYLPDGSPEPLWAVLILLNAAAPLLERATERGCRIRSVPS